LTEVRAVLRLERLERWLDAIARHSARRKAMRSIISRSRSANLTALHETALVLNDMKNLG
jgi:hypothetical protein